jgi:branched-chain amino acid transport system ATP-binding protein
MIDASPLLEVSGLNAGYGRIEVLHDVSLEVRRGEFVAIVGANGAGKTTLLRSIMGLVASRGRISFSGEDLSSRSASARAALRIGYVPEGRRVFPGLTVEENLRVGGYTNRDREAAGLEEVFDLFPRLAERRRQAARTLSGGEQQMLAMGRAMMVDPLLLFADEVSLGLAPIVIERIFDVMVEMNRRGRAVLLAEQDVAIALEAASRAYVLDTGSIALQGRATDLLDDPRVVSAYLQEV